MHAMPILLVILLVMTIAYRFYSKFLATKVAVLDDARETPAYRFNDGHNYHPTNKWVLFGHHFAAISGAGPLIGPVLAAQFGYMPGLLWILIGVCLGGAVQDFIILAASIRRGGKSLAQIAYQDIGKFAGAASTVSILFIVIIALAGLGKVVVKALGGEEVKYPADAVLVFQHEIPTKNADGTYAIPGGTKMAWNGGKSAMEFSDGFVLKTASQFERREAETATRGVEAAIPADAVRLVPGSSWGTFTIACTIPIALFVGLWMYKLRPGKVIEASLIGGALTLFATFLGGYVSQHSAGHYFNLADYQITYAMAAYGFIASVLPVWVLLCPRDYLSSFLKIGTIILLVGGTIIANPKLEAPMVQHAFLGGGPVFAGNIFPFLFIVIMCGAISGFHALVSSGTTPKMIKRESDARIIGYGSMLIEGLVGVVALIAATALPVGDYYAMNTDLAKAPAYYKQFKDIGADIDHLNMYEQRTQESLRGRTGGAVTLAVGMAHIFDGAAAKISVATEETLQTMWKYWYHFAIMFEALFILTTIDTGTRIGRFLLQEVMGKIHPSLGIKGSVGGAILSTGLIVLGWTYFINANSMAAIWPMFGVANQMLAVIALAVAGAYLANSGRAKYVWVTILPMLVVMTTTSSAAVLMIIKYKTTIATQLAKSSPDMKLVINSGITMALLAAMIACALVLIFGSFARIALPQKVEETQVVSV